MFIGQYYHSLDNKGRLIIPAKYRSVLGERFILTAWFDTNLIIFPLDIFNSWLEQKFEPLKLSDEDGRELERYIYGNAIECEPDKQGRIVISEDLRKIARVKKDVVLIGISNRIEIWGREVREECQITYEDIRKKLTGLGI